MNNSSLVEMLRAKVDIFADFAPEALDALLHSSRVATFEPNEFIIEIGKAGSFLGVIMEGTARVITIDDSGAEHAVADLGPNKIFGEMALLTGDPASASVVGLTRCKVLIIPSDAFSTMVAANPSAMRRLMKLLSERSMFRGREETRRLAESARSRSKDPYGLQLLTDEPQKLLVLNCGSSSVKYSLFNTGDSTTAASGLIERIGLQGTKHAHKAKGQAWTWELPTAGYPEAFAAVIKALTAADTGVVKSASEISAVGHRVVHGGEKYSEPVIVSGAVLSDLEKLNDLAPLHNPVNIAGIREAMRVLPKATQVAVFDTAFHHTLPPYAYLYGLPYEYYEKQGIRRYGFHGTSHAYVSLKAAQFLQRPYGELEIISCHLGNGASVCAIDHGRSIDTSMGFTPTEGLIMGTRCGQVDPGIFAYLMRKEGMDVERFSTLINKESGLKGISGISADMREIQKAAAEGNHRALLAFKTFCYQVRKYIGAYVAAMQGLNVVIFTGGIGEHSSQVRSLVCQGLEVMGIRLDEGLNASADAGSESCVISARESTVKVLVVHTDEERMIARELLRAISMKPAESALLSREPVPIPVEVSAHHVHLSTKHVEELFGAGHKLTPKAPLSQPGQFACEETVSLVGPKGRVDRVRVLGPERNESQVEIAMTEQYKLGIHPPVRESGDIEHTPGVTLEAPNGKTVTLEKGVICAMRHIHMSPEDALKIGVKDRYIVRVKIQTDRELVFGDVLVRVHPNFKLAMHLDTDEGNAANVAANSTGIIVGIESRG